jgi:hypothetical protein
MKIYWLTITLTFPLFFSPTFLASMADSQDTQDPGEEVQDKLDNLGSRWHVACGILLPDLQSFQCPLTYLPMVDPVIASDGRTYSERALKRYFKHARDLKVTPTSPLTRAVMTEEYIANTDLQTSSGRIRAEPRNNFGQP